MARLYVGTYKKYNNGNLFGEWIDLEQFNDAKEFFEYCAELHKDEEDPEFMLQDYEDFPDRFYNECMTEDEVQEIYDFLKYNDDDRAIIEEYWDEVDEDVDADKVLEYYCGELSGEEYAEQLADELGETDNLPNFIRNHIDWEGIWREMEYDGYHETTNYVFDTNR